MKTLAVLFGLNYNYTSNTNERDKSKNFVSNGDMKLKGCINDTLNVANYLEVNGIKNIEIYNDIDNIEDTTCKGFVTHFQDIIDRSYSENLDYVFFYYSGHGTNVECHEGDELDGRDECIVPSDYNINGVIKDDLIID